MIEQLLSSMSLRDKVAQMLMVGFQEPDLSDHAIMMIAEYHVGGIILFRRNIENPEQVARLTNELQTLSLSNARAPLLIGIDQEGGTVARLTGEASVFPGNMAIGATGCSQNAYHAARMTATELRSVGIQANFAPVVDVNNNPANPVIGVRSYGECPEMVAEMGAMAVRGYRDGGVLAVPKHFPGHGDTDIDSHLALPAISHSRARLDEVELKPFRACIAAGAEAIMTAHVHCSALEPHSTLPATLSYHTVTNLLRQELGFEGLVFTDCMQMKAIADTYGTPEGSVMAVKAGADCLLVCHSLDVQLAVIERLVDAVRQGEIEEERIEQSVQRLLAAKSRLGLFGQNQVELKQVRELVGSAEHLAKAKEIMEQAVTLVRNDHSLLPLRLEAPQRILVITPIAAAQTLAEDERGVRSSLGLAIKNRHTNVREVAYAPAELDAYTIQLALGLAATADIIIVGTLNASRHQGQAQLVNDIIKQGKPTVVIALGGPYDLLAFPHAPVYMVVYENSDLSVTAAANCLFGCIVPKGRLPVSIGRMEE